MPTTTLHTPAEGPEEPDRPVTSTSEPYWRHEMWRPAGYRDSTGALADLARRALTVLLRLRWRLTLDVTVRTFVAAADEQAACLAVTDALRHPDTVIALSRAEPDTIPPWRALCTADRIEIVVDAHAVDAGTDDLLWRCTAVLLLRFTVDVADAGWPADHFAVDVVPARTQPRLLATDARTYSLIRRTPTRTQPRHRRPSNPG
jgi:hypothetical protein